MSSMISELRRHLLDEFDPSTSVCAVVLARFVDMADDEPLLPDELTTVAVQARATRQVPVGPLVYEDGAGQQILRTQSRVRTITVLDAQGRVALRVGLMLGPGGCIGIGGTRHGHPGPQGDDDPSAMLLPDVEAGLAELVVYARERARLRGYTQRVDVVLELHFDGPIRAQIVDPENGRAVDGRSLDTFEPIAFSYSLDMSEDEIQFSYYEAACELARRFGAEEPQFLTPQFLREESVVL